MKRKAPFYLRQWRKHRGYTLERFSEMVGISVGYLSDLERGKERFHQDHLENFAVHLRCSPQDLIMRDPSEPDPLWTIVEQIPESSRPQAVAMLKALARTGTDG